MLQVVVNYVIVV